PERIDQNGNTGGFRTIILRSDEAAKDRMKADDLEIITVDDSGLNFARLAQAHHGHANGREIAKFADGMDAGFEVLDFGDGPVLFIHPDTFGGLLNIDEAVFVGVDERAKQHATNKAEDRRICADTEG